MLSYFNEFSERRTYGMILAACQVRRRWPMASRHALNPGHPRPRDERRPNEAYNMRKEVVSRQPIVTRQVVPTEETVRANQELRKAQPDM